MDRLTRFARAILSMGFGPACAEAHIHWARGFHRLGAVTLSALLGVLLWAIGLGIVAIWLIVLVALAWAAFRSARWVLAAFRADSPDTIDPRGLKEK